MVKLLFVVVEKEVKTMHYLEIPIVYDNVAIVVTVVEHTNYYY